MFHELKLQRFESPEALVYIRCSKGTYIRSFARDLGLALNSGAHLTGLRRTAIGNIDVNQAMSIENFDSAFDSLKERWNNEGLIGVNSRGQL
jgi:tRNA pseudouridine55 synthase